VATSYYSTKKGVNFGGHCGNASCPSQALADKQVAFAAGMVRPGRFSIFFIYFVHHQEAIRNRPRFAL
jgi:hypothetical protein